jgi:hypothetical protein
MNCRPTVYSIITDNSNEFHDTGVRIRGSGQVFSSYIYKNYRSKVSNLSFHDPAARVFRLPGGRFSSPALGVRSSTLSVTSKHTVWVSTSKLFT